MSNSNKTLRLFFYTEDVVSGIFESQVLQYLQFLKSSGCEVTLICFGSLKFFLKDRKSTLNKLKKVTLCRLHFIFLPAFSPFKIPGKCLWSFYACFFVCYSLFFKKRLIIQARGIWSTVIGYKIKHYIRNTRLIFDMRGDEVSEYKYNPCIPENETKKHRAEAIEKYQKECLIRSDICLFVSQAMKKMALARAAATLPENYVIPSTGLSRYYYYDEDVRGRRRRELRLENKFVVGYSGSVVSWQRMDKVLEVFDIVRSIRRDAALLVFTKEVLEFKTQYLRSVTDDSIMVRTAGDDDLGEYLQCFDMGVLLRDRLVLNQVASPTKFAEYLLCGVPSLVSGGIGDLEDIVNKQEVGICIQDLNNHNALVDGVKQFVNKQFNRESIAQYGKSAWARESYLDVYKEIFEMN
ncbi:MAG: glycosyltransferase [Candidatus Aureabacteria bacterium]|nr:glycosyltransferase [Candidatus Auribacterota bacterium]